MCDSVFSTGGRVDGVDEEPTQRRISFRRGRAAAVLMGRFALHRCRKRPRRRDFSARSASSLEPSVAIIFVDSSALSDMLPVLPSQ